MLRKLITIALCGLGLIPIAEAQTKPVQLSDVSFTIDLPEGLPSEFQFDLPINGKLETVEVSRSSIRHAQYLLLASNAEAWRTLVPPAVRTYRGVIDGDDQSLVALSKLSDGVHAMIATGAGETFFVQPSGTNNGAHVLSRQSPFDLGACGADELIQPELTTPRNPSGGLAGDATRVIELSIDTDYELFVHNGSDTNAMVADVEMIINMVDALFERDVQLRVWIGAFILRTTPSDPYTADNTADLLCEAVNKWDEVEMDPIRGDAVQLLSGRIFSGAIGTAYLNAVCAGKTYTCSYIQHFAVSVVATHFSSTLDKRVALSAHELGHNLGATHCSGSGCHIMCSSIGSCGGVAGSNLEFGSLARGQILSYVSTAGCLQAVQPLLSIPFVEDFEEGELLLEHWIDSRHAAVDYFGSSEPSGLQSVSFARLEGGQDDVPGGIAMQALALSFHANGELRFWAQHYNANGPGHSLVVEYLGPDLAWHNLQTITPAEVSSSIYREFTIPLPSAAHWNGCHIRFQSLLAEGGFELWSVDLIEIDATPVSSLENDECDAPLEIFDGPNPISTLGSTDSAEGVPIPCAAGGLPIRNDAWFSYSASCTGELRFIPCIMFPLDSRIAVYNAASGCDGTSLDLLACGDPNSPTCAGQVGSYLSMSVQAGDELLVRIGSLDGSTAEGTLLVSCTQSKPDCPPDFDGNGIVDGADLSALLGAWGTPHGDLNGDGSTTGADLSIVLGAWGVCR